VASDPGNRQKKPARSSEVIRATPAGRKAQDIWRPLSCIEKRWETRSKRGVAVWESLERW
jgi:hypothetical protein